MILRRLTPDDWAAFRDIRLDMLLDAPDAFGAAHSDWAARSEADIRDWIARMTPHALVDGDRILGCAALHRLRGARLDHRAEVIAVYLRPAARGQGHMTRLMTALADAARADGVLQLELEVAAGNAPARALYARAGFQQVGTRPRAMRGAAGFVDTVIYVRRLDSP